MRTYVFSWLREELQWCCEQITQHTLLPVRCHLSRLAIDDRRLLTCIPILRVLRVWTQAGSVWSDCQGGVKNINVQHNIKLSGKSGCNHQIDVYWEFEMMGIKHCVAIECKNYSSEVSVGKMRDFFGVLHDVGNTNGIFVTKVGYQSGAEKFANYYGIVLKVLKFPTMIDWKDRVKNIEININALSIDIKERNIDIDFEWLFANSNVKEDDQIFLGAMTDELKIIDSSGKVITTLHELENLLPRDNAEINKEAHRQFSDEFLVGPSGECFKLKGIRYLYDVVSETHTSITEGDAIARAILKDVKSGAVKFFDINGNVRDIRDD